MIGSDSSTASIGHASDRGLALAFGLTLSAAFVLPLLPIWASLLRLLAFAVLLHRHELPRFSAEPRRWLAPCLFGLLYLACTLQTLGEFLASPLRFPVKTIRFVNGVPTAWEWSVLRLVVDVYLVQALMRMAWPSPRADGALYVRAILICLASFLVLPHIHLLWSGFLTVFGSDAALDGDAVARLEAEMAGIPGWTVWVLTALLGLRLLRNPGTHATVFACVFFAGVVQAALVLAQHAAQDFSYVIEAHGWQDYFKRTRGSYYYHGASALFLTLAFFFSLGARTAIRSPIIHTIGLSLMGLAIYQNNTKAIAFGVIAGATTFAIMRVGRSVNWREPILALVFAALFLPEVFVVKSPEASWPAQVESSQLAAANRPRIYLLTRGAEMVWKAPLLGQGVGTARIEFDEPHFGGLLETDSSHALPIDIVLMAGVPAFLFLGALVTLAAVNEARRRIAAGVSSADGLFAAALLAFLAAFIVTSLFFPRERNLTIALVFLVFSLSAVKALRPPEPNGCRMIGSQRKLWFGLGTLGLAGFGWALVTSSTGVFPVAELMIRQMRDPLSLKVGTVYTNSSRLELLLRGAFLITGADGWDVRRLADDPDLLPRYNGWVLWDPSRDHDYSRLRQEFGFAQSRRWRLAPSFNLPHEWQVVPSLQSAVSIIHVGARMYPPMPAEELGRVVTNLRAVGIPETRHDMPTPVPAERMVGGEACAAEWQLEPHLNRQPTVDGYELVIDTDAGQAHLYFEFEDAAGIGRVFRRSVRARGGMAIISELIPQTRLNRLRLCVQSPIDIRRIQVWFFQRLMPNMTRTSAVWEQDQANPTASMASDDDHGSAWVAMSQGEATLVFKPQEHDGPLSMYRLSGVRFGEESFATALSWQLEGSEDGLAWEYLDQRSGITLPSGREKFATFYAERPDSFRYYRLRIQGGEHDSSNSIGLAEVQLFAASE